MILQALRNDQFTAFGLAVVYDALKCIEVFVQKLEINLFYCSAKPGSYQYSDTESLKSQIFPLAYSIMSENFDMF